MSDPHTDALYEAIRFFSDTLENRKHRDRPLLVDVGFVLEKLLDLEEEASKQSGGLNGHGL